MSVRDRIVVGVELMLCAFLAVWVVAVDVKLGFKSQQRVVILDGDTIQLLEELKCVLQKNIDMEQEQMGCGVYKRTEE